nr:FAST kinase domain-containing protein 1, mitochondrial-like [Lytechinus pictus]
MASCRIVRRVGIHHQSLSSVQPIFCRVLSTETCYHTTQPQNRIISAKYLTRKKGVHHSNTQVKKSSIKHSHPFAGLKEFHTSCSLGLLEDIESCLDHTNLLMLVGQNRAKLDENHVSHALVQLWEVMKFTPNRTCVLETEVHHNRDFLSLCVLAENKVHLMKEDVLPDVLYAAIKLLSQDLTHSLIRELRNKCLSCLDRMSCKQLSKVAVCLSDLHEGKTSSCGAVTHAFGQKLDTIEDIRELSAWMRECLPLASPSLCSRSFAKALEFIDRLDADSVGKNDLRRVLQAAAKVSGSPQALIEKCAKLFLEKMEKDEISVKNVCTIYQQLHGGLDYNGENIQPRVSTYLRGKLPEINDGAEASLVINILAERAKADTKFQLEDKAVELIDRVPMNYLHHLCHGLKSMNYTAMTPLTKKITAKLQAHGCRNLSVDGVAKVLEFLIRIEGINETLYKNMYIDLAHMLNHAIAPGRVVHIIYCISLLPVSSVSNMVFSRASAILHQLHTPGINQLLNSIVRISRRMERKGPLPNGCTNLIERLQELAINSINQITSVWYLNNIIDFLLEEGDQTFLIGVAMQRYSHILSKLTPQLAVDCARHVFRSKCLQPDLLDEIAKLVIQNTNKITPLQVSYILSPFSSLNYKPNNASDLFDACISRMEPFLDSLPAGYVVDVANICALSQRYPETVLKKIFSLDFLTRLDEELETIPERSMMYRRKLMHLNRSVALECPEMQVPWFHEDFCRDILKSRKVLVHSSLREIQSALADVLGGPQFLRSFVVTPYHYDISFECLVDNEGSPLPCADYGSVLNQLKGVAGGVLADLMQWGTQTKQMPEGAQRVAIDYLFSNSYCANSRHALGIIAMKKRHLELMGYKYIQIPYFEWHSAELSEPEDKLQYLQEKLSQSVSTLPGDRQTLPLGSQVSRQWDPQGDIALNGLSAMQNADFVEDPLVMKVLNTFDRMGGRRT